jgi:hypothetical protein
MTSFGSGTPQPRDRSGRFAPDPAPEADGVVLSLTPTSAPGAAGDTGETALRIVS